MFMTTHFPLTFRVTPLITIAANAADRKRAVTVPGGRIFKRVVPKGVTTRLM